MSLAWRVVPIERWPGEQTRSRRHHPFRSKNAHGWMDSRVDWSGTVDLLERELRQLRAKDVVLQMAITDRDIRNDGWIRANASPAHPGVILTFDSKHGPLSYPCDTFRDWQANVRAIALALEALRKVDRYGVTRRGEQYTGWKRLPGAGGTTATMTAEAAARVVREGAGWEDPEGEADDVGAILGSRDDFRAYYRDAARRLHADAGGSVRDFQLLQEAKSVLEAHHGGAR